MSVASPPITASSPPSSSSTSNTTSPVLQPPVNPTQLPSSSSASNTPPNTTSSPPHAPTSSSSSPSPISTASSSSTGGGLVLEDVVTCQANLFNQGFSSFLQSGDFSDITLLVSCSSSVVSSTDQQASTTSSSTVPNASPQSQPPAGEQPRKYALHRLILAYNSRYFRKKLEKMHRESDASPTPAPTTLRHEATKTLQSQEVLSTSPGSTSWISAPIPSNSSGTDRHFHRRTTSLSSAVAEQCLADAEHSSDSPERQSFSEHRRRKSYESNLVLTLELPQSATTQDFELVLKFMYDGDVAVTEKNAVPLMKMANFMQMRPLKKLAGEFLARHITRDNALSMLHRAIEFDADEIQTKCIGTISKHFSQVLEETGVKAFVDLPCNIMLAITAQDNLITTSEYLVYQTVCQYLDYNSPKFSPAQVEQLFETVRFPLLTVEQLEEANTNPIVPRFLLTEALLYRLKRHEPPAIGADRLSVQLSQEKIVYLLNLCNLLIQGSSKKEVEDLKQLWLVKRATPRAAFAVSLEFAHDFDENGIFYFIGTGNRKEEWTNPALRGRVRISSSSQEKGNVFDILDRDPHEFWTMDVPASWVCLNLGSGRSLVPTYYTIRHGCNSKADCLRNWLLQGSNDSHTWTVILRHTEDTSLCSNFGTASWPINNCTQAFRYFRILQTGHNSSNHNFLAISGIEIYGDLYEAKRPTNPTAATPAP